MLEGGGKHLDVFFLGEERYILMHEIGRWENYKPPPPFPLLPLYLLYENEYATEDGLNLFLEY